MAIAAFFAVMVALNARLCRYQDPAAVKKNAALFRTAYH